MYFVYILECADRTLYVGCTNDLARRLQQHNHAKQGARYTKTRRPVVLVYHEPKRTRGSALRREHEIKSWRRAKKLALIAAKKIGAG
jgi:putative endonuclease